MNREAEPNPAFAAILAHNRVCLGSAASMADTVGALIDALEWPAGWDVSGEIVAEAAQKISDAAGLMRMAYHRLPEHRPAAPPPAGGSK